MAISGLKKFVQRTGPVSKALLVVMNIYCMAYLSEEGSQSGHGGARHCSGEHRMEGRAA